MRALIVVDHGSRQASANDQSEQLCEIIRTLRPESQVILAHLSLLGPTIADAVGQAVAQRADEVVVLPYFLGSGRHSVDDIPRLAAEVSAVHPGLSITVGRPLGPSAAIADLLLKSNMV
jgi:sirohydrochlorin cobaltochelatase